jgi:hypothetical protein
VSLVQLVRFLVVELSHSVLNLRFNMGVALGGDIPVDNETLLMTDFMNLKIKPLNLSDMLIRIWCAYVCSYV